MDPSTNSNPTDQPADIIPTSPSPQQPPAIPEAETSPSPDIPATPEVSPAPIVNQASAEPVLPVPEGSSPEPSVTTDSAEPVISGAAASSVKPGRFRHWLLPVVVFVVLVLLAGGYVFGFYLPNTPANIYKKALSNTADGYDKLMQYNQGQAGQSQKGYEFDGSFKLSGNGATGDGTFSGQSDGKNGTGKLDFDLMGQKFTANTRVITASGQTSPDIYLQVSGIKSILDAYGLNTLDSLDGQWLVIDHTLLDSVAGSAADESSAKIATPTTKQVQDVLAKIGAVNRDYLFTTNSGTAVLTNNKYLGKSTQNGRQVYGYEVGYNKAHLKTYVTSLGKALDGSQLDAWAKQVYDGKSLSDVLNLTGMQKDVDNLKGNETFHLYVDAKTKLVSRIEFTDQKDNSTFFITQDYTGGSIYPFSVGISNSPESDATLSLQFDTKTNTYTLGFSMTPGSKTTGSEGVTADFHMNLKPSNTSVNVTAPAGAESVTDLLNELGLSGGVSGPAADSAVLDSGNLFTLTQ